MSIAENIALVRANIAQACAQAGRSPEEITLVGASKMNDAAACRRPSPPALTPWGKTASRR